MQHLRNGEVFGLSDSRHAGDRNAVGHLGGAEEPVDVGKELMIVDLAVIEDPIRTDPQEGESAVWTFKHLMEQMAGDTDPSDFVMNWLLMWTVRPGYQWLQIVGTSPDLGQGDHTLVGRQRGEET